MNWRAKLQEQRGAIFQKGPGDSLTKLTKPSSVGFVSDPSGRFANIEDAAPLDVAALKTERARLLALAVAEWINAAHVHRLHDADLAACLGLDDHQRATFLHLLADTADRHTGRVPLADTAAIHCHHCGPVWAHPGIAAALPRVGGWPRALGCPWCFVRKAGGYIPRPAVTCSDCQHYNPDTLNPAEGMGTCTSGKGMHWAAERHTCASFQPDKEPTA